MEIFIKPEDNGYRLVDMKGFSDYREIEDIKRMCSFLDGYLIYEEEGDLFKSLIVERHDNSYVRDINTGKINIKSWFTTELIWEKGEIKELEEADKAIKLLRELNVSIYINKGRT